MSGEPAQSGAYPGDAAQRMKYAPAMLARITAATKSTMTLFLLLPRARCAAGGSRERPSGARRS